MYSNDDINFIANEVYKTKFSYLVESNEIVWIYNNRSMNYYFIRQRDQQYSNCLYLSRISKNYKLNDNYRSFTLPGQIEYTFSEDLYKQFKKEINTVK